MCINKSKTSALISSNMVHKSPGDHLKFVNSLDPDQDRQNVGPDLDPDCLRGAKKNGHF